MENVKNEPKEVKVHLVRVALNDHEHQCLAKEAKENHRVASKELAHQVSLRYRGTNVK